VSRAGNRSGRVPACSLIAFQVAGVLIDQGLVRTRVDLRKQGFLIPAPEAPWIECVIVEISDDGACLEVGALAVPKIFGLAFTAGGEVLRVCSLIWRRGELIGARFVTAKELRQRFEPLLKAPAG
jgi:hypothetical protein